MDIESELAVAKKELKDAKWGLSLAKRDLTRSRLKIEYLEDFIIKHITRDIPEMKYDPPEPRIFSSADTIRENTTLELRDWDGIIYWYRCNKCRKLIPCLYQKADYMYCGYCGREIEKEKQD